MEIKGKIFGNKRPLICVSVTEKNAEAAIEKIKQLSVKDIDVIELRADILESGDINKEVDIILDEALELLKYKPLIFTYRTKAEGGAGNPDEAVYINIIKNAARHKATDIVDVEPARLCNPKEVRGTIKRPVLMSYHDFQKTPQKEFVTERLSEMYEMGADIAKIAVMPQKMPDVATLLCASAEVKEKYPERPLITISMGKLGMTTRLAGGAFGSCLTFATDGRASAPGQIPFDKVAEVLDVFDEYAGD